MKIALASDHGGFKLKEFLKKYIEKQNIDYIDLGTDSEESVDYPDFAAKMAQAIKNQQADIGILVCGTGIGISIAANRYHGIRAAILYDDDVARLAKEHNNANVVVFGGRTMSEEDCLRRLQIFLETKFAGGRHERRIATIEECR